MYGRKRLEYLRNIHVHTVIKNNFATCLTCLHESTRDLRSPIRHSFIALYRWSYQDATGWVLAIRGRGDRPVALLFKLWTPVLWESSSFLCRFWLKYMGCSAGITIMVIVVAVESNVKDCRHEKKQCHLSHHHQNWYRRAPSFEATSILE